MTFTLKFSLRTIAGLMALSQFSVGIVDIVDTDDSTETYVGSVRYAEKSPQTMDELDVTVKLSAHRVHIFRMPMPDMASIEAIADKIDIPLPRGASMFTDAR